MTAHLDSLIELVVGLTVLVQGEVVPPIVYVYFGRVGVLHGQFLKDFVGLACLAHLTIEGGDVVEGSDVVRLNLQNLVKAFLRHLKVVYVLIGQTLAVEEGIPRTVVLYCLLVAFDGLAVLLLLVKVVAVLF